MWAQDAAKTGEDGQPVAKEEETKQWDTEFVKVDQGTLFELILARGTAPGGSEPGRRPALWPLPPPSPRSPAPAPGRQLPEH